MLTLKDIKALNIEITSRCSARCPFCSRGQKVRPYPGRLLTLADFKKLPPSLFHEMHWITFAGNFGDLSSNPETTAIAEYIKTLNPGIVLGGETNGSLQDEAWWSSLGACFNNGSMEFALDGLEDTHAIHRVGADFNKVIRNIRAFTGAGGGAHWKFIVFEHNEHQIEEAEKLAGEIGCTRFFVVSSRDYNDKYRKPATMEFRQKRDLFQTWRAKADEDGERARCKPLSNGSLYIAADGTVHPCCFAHCMYISEHNEAFRFIVPLIEKYKDEINFKTRPLEQILQGPYFRKVLAASQTNPYCMTKCNKYRKKIKKQLVLRDTRYPRKASLENNGHL